MARETASQQFARMMRPKPRPIARLSQVDSNGTLNTYPIPHGSYEINLITDQGDKFAASLSVAPDDDGVPMVLVLIAPVRVPSTGVYTAARSIKIRLDELI